MHLKKIIKNLTNEKSGDILKLIKKYTNILMPWKKKDEERSEVTIKILRQYNYFHIYL